MIPTNSLKAATKVLRTKANHGKISLKGKFPCKAFGGKTFVSACILLIGTNSSFCLGKSIINYSLFFFINIIYINGQIILNINMKKYGLF